MILFISVSNDYVMRWFDHKNSELQDIKLMLLVNALMLFLRMILRKIFDILRSVCETSYFF